MRVGTWVRLKPGLKQYHRDSPRTAKIIREDDAYSPGAVKLDAPLDGFHWWNKSDLVAVRAPKRRPRTVSHDVR